MSITIEDIVQILKNPLGSGYVINFRDGRQILLHKRRTIPALLTLIRYGEGCEADLTKSSTNLAELKVQLAGKMDPTLFADSYSDANKPFSELWNEEGFTFITNPVGQTRLGSKKYVLDPRDHDLLFGVAKKAERKPPSKDHQAQLMADQESRCNLCRSEIVAAKSVKPTAFARDRRRLVWDHRVPVEKGGDSNDGNYQALCFYCNKCKWQICNICQLPTGACSNCALAFPESTSVVSPTGEDISDRAPHRERTTFA